MSLELDEHRAYLSDSVRLDCFQRALSRVITPGDVVLDLASGTGILGLLACRAGAARVYALDGGSIAGLARDIAHVNGLSDRIHVVRQHSEWATLPERVDVIVTDQIGRIAFDAGLYEYMIDARERLAKPGARLIPRAVELWFAPCEQEQLRAGIDFWRQPIAGLKWDPALTIARNTGYPHDLSIEELLASPERLVRTDLQKENPTSLKGTLEFVASRAGTLDALAGWFAAELADDVWMTNGPSGPRINRRVGLLAVHPGIAVAAGDHVSVRLHIRPTTSMVAWLVHVTSPDGVVRGSVSRSTFQGMLVSEEDLSRARPHRASRLSRAGRIRKQILDLCDGRRTVGEIEHTLYVTNPDFFASPEAAARFAAEVLQRYAE